MPSRTRALRSLLVPAAAAAAVLTVALTAGCTSSSASSASSGSSAVASVTPAAAGTGAAVVAPGGPVGPAGDAVYFAEGGDVRGSTAHEPPCAGGCALSGDGTAQLSDMAWPIWTGVKAVGHGTEQLDDCKPNCAAGKLYPVKVTVVFTKPVHVCANNTSRWYWTHISFTWPAGLPPVFKGANAPINPLVYSQLASQGHMSCA